MKKRVIATFLTSLMLMAILAGCGDSASKPAEDASSVGTEAEDIKWPEKSINFIMGFKAGGGADITARALFQPYVENVLGQKFVFNYMEGSNGEISYTTLAKSTAPDGYTIAWGAYPGFLTMPLTKDSCQFVLEDFQPVASLTTDPNVIVVPADSKINTLADLVDYCKENPSEFTMGIGALAADDSLACEQFIKAADIDVNQVVYSEGTTERVTAIMGGHIMGGIMNASELAPYGDSLKALGVMSEERISFIPDVPTLIEQGYDVTNSVYRGILMPAGVDEAIVKKLSDAIGEELQDPECIQTLENQNLIVNFMDYQTYTEELYKMRDIYAEIIDGIDFAQ